MDMTLHDAGALALQIAMGLSLAACAGLRAFLPLLVVGVAGRMDYLPLTRSFEWLESWPALIVFGVAVAAELLADKVPVVDNFLDAVQGFAKPIAGTILVASVVTELPPLYVTVLALVLGGGAAGAVHLTKANLRVASTVTTGGVGNPVLSLVEDAGALLGSIAAIVVPVIVVLLIALALFLMWRMLRRGGRAAARAVGP
jgi:hypothetical protein